MLIRDHPIPFLHVSYIFALATVAPRAWAQPVRDRLASTSQISNERLCKAPVSSIPVKIQSCDASGSRTARPANFVRIVFNIGRHIKLNHVRDASHVQAPRSHARGNENPRVSALETAERFVAFQLRTATVQQLGVKTHRARALAQAVRRVTLLHENDGASLDAPQVSPKLRVPLVRIDKLDHLLNAPHRGPSLAHLDATVVRPQKLAREPANAIWKGRAEQRRLTRVSEREVERVHEDANDFFESHIEHLVSLVQYQRLHKFKRHFVVAEQVVKAPGRPCQHICRGRLKRADLRHVIVPSEHRR